jgi:hypothetical protein
MDTHALVCIYLQRSLSGGRRNTLLSSLGKRNEGERTGLN